MSLRGTKQLLSPVTVNGKMLNDDLMKELEKLYNSKRQRPEEFNCSNVTAPKKQKKEERNVKLTSWNNKTEYQCQICSCLFSEINGFIKHTNAVHGMSVEEYKLEFGQLTPNPIDYKCQICEQVVKCNGDLIRR